MNTEHKKYLIQLIAKYEEGFATDEEIAYLANFYISHQNSKEWPYEIELKEKIKRKVFDKIQSEIRSISKKETKVRFINFKKYFKYAALVVLMLSVGYYFQQVFFNNPSIVVPDDAITLQLGNGNIEIISTDGSTQVVDEQGNVLGSQKGTQLIYTNKVEKEVLVYNTLTVPYGKRFEVQLSDGTHVHLNAGTSLKYPVKFIEGEERQVFLNGEAYFDVSKDTNHPFVVNSGELNIRVLGTQFNISSYPEDKHINTVLVEGSVSIYNKSESYNQEVSTLLEPGFKAAWRKVNNQIVIDQVDTKLYIAWINGTIRFRHMQFKNIIKKLERHYNITIVNNNISLGDKTFTGSFDTETLPQVLETLNTSHKIEYEIINNQIIIN